MSRTKMLAIALGTAIAIATPISLVLAQSRVPVAGDALAKAELACVDRGVRPYTPSFESCVRSVATSFDRRASVSGHEQTAVLRRAREVCASYGIPPNTLNDRHCLKTETDRRLPVSPVTHHTVYILN